MDAFVTAASTLCAPRRLAGGRLAALVASASAALAAEAAVASGSHPLAALGRPALAPDPGRRTTTTTTTTTDVAA